jgi:hypothetical protein
MVIAANNRIESGTLAVANNRFLPFRPPGSCIQARFGLLWGARL